MTSRLAKSFAVLAAVAALAGASQAPVLSPLMLTVTAAHAGQGADDLAGSYTPVAVAPRTAIKVRHRHHHGRKALRRADDNPTQRRVRGADDAPNHG